MRSTTESHLSHFGRLYVGDADPWRVRGSWPEEHKRRTVRRALGVPLMASGLELGCGNGITTGALVRRFLRLLAADGSPEALEHAGRELAGQLRIALRLMPLPAHLGTARYDAVIASELLYYLPSLARHQTLAAILSALRTNGLFICTNHLKTFSDAECSEQQLQRDVIRYFGNPLKSTAGAGWICRVFKKRGGFKVANGIT